MTSVFASDRGWLFNDLLKLFGERGCQTLPYAGADRWICLRSSEAHLSPDLSRTIIQLHTLEPRWFGTSSLLNKCRGFVCVHYAQPELLMRHGVDTSKPLMMRPIGAPRHFTVRKALPERFTAGWVGRDSGSFKRIGLYVEALSRMAKTVTADALLVGSQLAETASALRTAGVPTLHIARGNAEPAALVPYLEMYHEMDALVITSSTEAGPLPLFEALACGVPVVSTDCGWARRLIREGENGYIVQPAANEIIYALDRIRRDRRIHFTHRHDIAETVKGFVLEDWIDECLEFAEMTL